MKIIFRLLRFVKKYWIILLLAFMCLLASTIFGLIIPKMLGQGIDTVVNAGKKSSIILIMQGRKAL
ncbi:MAG: hypothetical protein NTV30_10125 [Chloroflexi bacterium]|nr:hypothetical protein [Chloroflexota bacterium]